MSPQNILHFGALEASAGACTGDDVAKGASLLVSDDSSFITGTELFVDGGMAQI